MSTVWTWFAPNDLPSAVMITPPPAMSDSVALAGATVIGNTMDGEQVSYRRPFPTRTHTWSFTLTRMKAIELRDFFTLFAGEKIKIVKHDDTILLGFFEINPLSLAAISRGVISDSVEKMTVEITFKSTNHTVASS